MLKTVSFLLLLLLAWPGLAQPLDETLPDPAQEQRAREISRELRCLVCQNQSIDDSNAPLARDLRILVRERIAAGDTDEEVKRFLVERYGAFVLLKPPVNTRTILLWLAPLMVFLGAALFLFRYLRSIRRVSVGTTQGLTKEEEEKLRALLAEETSQKPAEN